MSQSDPTFSEFYADYLAHHRHPWNRALHLAAKLLALAGLAAAVYERSILLLLAVPVLAVAPCWIGHLLFEGDRPVSWTQPSASMLGTLGRICGIGRVGHRGNIGNSANSRDSGDSGTRRSRLRAPAPAPDPDRRPRDARRQLPARPPGMRPYYSFAADLRMCGAMLGGLARPATPSMPATPATPASRGKTGASSAPT
jgi:hypothetical protein